MRIVLSTIVACLSFSALGAEPECTTEPKEKWQEQKAFEKNLTEQGYKIKKFKVTKKNCYEIYGKDKDGKKVEIYFNPVTGDKVKEEIN